MLSPTSSHLCAPFEMERNARHSVTIVAAQQRPTHELTIVYGIDDVAIGIPSPACNPSMVRRVLCNGRPEPSRLVGCHGYACRIELAPARTCTLAAALRRAASADNGTPPPSPPLSPPSSPSRGPTRPHACLGAPHVTLSPEGRSPPPSPPPSPPHPLEERLDLLAAAEDAVARHYTFPSEPENFTVDVLPYLVRLVISFGVRPMTANTRAVFAVLVRSDDKNDSPSDLFVYSLMLVPRASFVRWKAIVDTLRADGGYGATSALLSLAESPGASAPPSPPHSDSGDDPYDAVTTACRSITQETRRFVSSRMRRASASGPNT